MHVHEFMCVCYCPGVVAKLNVGIGIQACLLAEWTLLRK